MENLTLIKKFKNAKFIQFSPNGDYIVAVSRNQIIVIDANSLNEITVYNGLKDPGMIAFAVHDGKVFASKSAYKKLTLIELGDDLKAKSYRVTTSDEPQDFNIHFSPDNKKIITGIYNIYNNTISLLDLETSRIENVKVYENAFVNKIQYSDVDDIFLFSVFEREGRIIDGEVYSITTLLKWKYPFDTHEPIRMTTELIVAWDDISYNQETKKFALYDSREKTLIITDYTLKNECLRYNVTDRRSGYFSRLNWSLDGKYIVLTFLNSVKIINAQNAKCIKELKVSSGLYSEFSSDGNLLLIGTYKVGYLIDVSDLSYLQSGCT